MLNVIVLTLVYVGSVSMFTEKDFEREIKRTIKDRATEKLLIKEGRKLAKEASVLEVQLDGKVAEFQDMYDNLDLTRASVQSWMASIADLHEAFAGKVLDMRMLLADQMTEEEWNAVVQKRLTTKAAVDQAQANRYQYLNDEFDKLLLSVEKSVSQEAFDSTALRFEKLRTAFHTYYQTIDAFHFVENPVRQSYASTREDLQAQIDVRLEARRKLFDQVYTYGLAISDNLSNEEFLLILENLKEMY